MAAPSHDPEIRRWLARETGSDDACTLCGAALAGRVVGGLTDGLNLVLTCECHDYRVKHVFYAEAKRKRKEKKP